jgi:hypothetical protein
MKPRSAIKSDLFAAESRTPKIDSLGDPLVKIRPVVELATLASGVDPKSSLAPSGPIALSVLLFSQNPNRKPHSKLE